ncbi:MAG: hypothetical protein IPH84_05360 [Bacteroidales bacterium]|nr:hypothetical protein [Bacteroidales bacterium]
MESSDLKRKIITKINALEEYKLEELYGYLLNSSNSNSDLSDWTNLSEEQRKGIYKAILELESGEGIPNDTVFNSIRSRYV